MGYYLKVDGLFVGARHSKVRSKGQARYIPHPSAALDTARKMFEKGVGKEFELYTWVSEKLVERIENGT